MNYLLQKLYFISFRFCLNYFKLVDIPLNYCLVTECLFLIFCFFFFTTTYIFHLQQYSRITLRFFYFFNTCWLSSLPRSSSPFICTSMFGGSQFSFSKWFCFFKTVFFNKSDQNLKLQLVCCICCFFFLYFLLFIGPVE